VTGVVSPGEPGFDSATAVFNLAAPVRPASAVTVRTVEQVSAAIRRAGRERTPVRVLCTGHAAATARPMDGALLVRTRLAGGVEIDPRRRVARVPAGTLWTDVIEAAARHGLGAPHGSSPLVGAVGYLLRGGVSFYGRRVGVAANSVVAIELVTADGEPRRVDASTDQELFWALRGGGGGLGIVTAVEVRLFPAVQVVTGAAYWPATHADRLLAAWLRWTEDAPREATSSLRVMNLPDLPEIPPALRAGTTLCVDGVVLCETDDEVPAARGYAEDLLGPLRSVAEPVFDTWETTGPTAAAHTHMDPTEPFPIYGDHMLLDQLDDEGVAALLNVVGEGSGSPLTNVELRQLGGALAEPSPAGGAFDHLDAPLAYLGGGVPFGEVTAEALVGHCATVRAALKPWDTGWTNPTFVEHVDQPQRHLGADVVEAVDAVRARVDPAGMFAGDIAPNTTARH
jgi:hypothetical protein